MSLLLIYCLDIFAESLEYLNEFKSVYLLLIVGFVATVYLISCYLLKILNINKYKTN